MAEEDLDVTVEAGAVVISGHREQTREREGSTFHTWERSYGRFRRSFRLSDAADFDGAEASLGDGVLTLTVPKRADVRPRKIGVKKLGDRVKGLFKRKEESAARA